jgi:hypothetical protein
MNFPRGWELGVTVPCSICMRILTESNENEYYGGIGDKVCSKCNRNICSIHFNNSKGLCDDCLEQEKIPKKIFYTIDKIES